MLRCSSNQSPLPQLDAFSTEDPSVGPVVLSELVARHQAAAVLWVNEMGMLCIVRGAKPGEAVLVDKSRLGSDSEESALYVRELLITRWQLALSSSPATENITQKTEDNVLSKRDTQKVQPASKDVAQLVSTVLSINDNAQPKSDIPTFWRFSTALRLGGTAMFWGATHWQRFFRGSIFVGIQHILGFRLGAVLGLAGGPLRLMLILTVES